MSSVHPTYGEVHCLLCGRCLAEVRTGDDGRLHLRRIPGQDPNESVRLVRGRLQCARCGGRAFVEWDLMPVARATSTAEVAA